MTVEIQNDVQSSPWLARTSCTLRELFNTQTPISFAERLRACSGIFFGLLATSLLCQQTLGSVSTTPWLIAPLGASAALLFAAPSSPMAQPWPVLAGNLLSACVGLVCAAFIPHAAVAVAVAAAGACMLMFSLHCLHPPGSAIAVLAALGGPALADKAWPFLQYPVALNSLLLVLLVLLAIVYNNLTGRRYPHINSSASIATDAAPAGQGFSSSDLDAVIRNYGEVLDISRDDLQSLFQQTAMQAYRRRFGEIICADIMLRNPLAIEFGTNLEEAWAVLHASGMEALPVIDPARRVIGMLTLQDFIAHAGIELHKSLKTKLQHLIRRSGVLHTEKPEVAGQIMQKTIRIASEEMHIAELVPLMSAVANHCVAVVDSERRLSGIISQSALVNGLYRRRLNEIALPS
jgi:CBS domain-containing membrane protein